MKLLNSGFTKYYSQKGLTMAKTRQNIEDIDIKETTEVVDVKVTGDSAVPTTTAGGSVMQQVNTEFEGLDTIASFMPYFILDGSELLNKTDNSVHPAIEVVLEGGKPVWQLWDLSSNLIAESFDGVTDTAGRPMADLLAAEKAKSAEPEKIKIQARYEIYFDWEYAEDGNKLTKISLSPASKFAFAEYTKELAKQGKKLSEVITRIGAERTVSKQGFRYSKATFENVGDVK
jgi:hypothetical protein